MTIQMKAIEQYFHVVLFLCCASWLDLSTLKMQRQCVLFVILYQVDLGSEMVREFGSAAALQQKVRGMMSVNDPII